MTPRLKKAGAALLRALEVIRRRLDRGTAHWLNRWKDSATLSGETDFRNDADSMIIRQEPLRARVLMYALLAAVVLFVVWTALIQVDEITRGDAKVIPSRQLQVLQSLDGGIVSKILVQEGQAVSEGQVLLQVDSTRFESSVRENRSQYLSLAAKAARLRAIGEGKPFVPPPEVLAEDPQTVDEERRLFETATSELQTQLMIARQQLAQRSQELNEATAKQRQAAQAYDSTSRELAVTRPLLSSGAVSEVELLRLERDVARFKGEREIAGSQIARVQASISESTRKIQEVELVFRNTASKEYSETMARLNALTQSGTGLADRVKQSALRSPVKGTIKRLLVNTVGGVVQPGRDVVEIVPLEGRLLLEAKVAPRDIAFLQPGQRAIVKFTAYDFAVYGGLNARVEHIGADSVTDDRGNTFYTVRVATDQSTLAGNLPIIPGMVAEVDIITGKKTILSYLLKPVLRAKSAAMTER
ncbi:HlyD family type I secretion periplasmic adaptor subunit [Massilia sp. PAMC28688]|uniref:HlyD family type I secretion periplasmic adaptor subunit n=1 Tax=Massilia sp. PAMC28688 TaxID=2861283 RepID=UPI001C62FF10|nr:HlyD family type I secretion periplasmic adaptor subunit [Massilia sp. PAMC28688]QYF93778.1 HlyD family type I secretion periplasmic adaptor subunit [Massilia sp. PAMC28688]